LGADYWKPVQCGTPRDSEMIQSLVTNHETKIHKEGIFLETPVSPHAAADAQDVTLDVEHFVVPDMQNDNLIIEGAGGCLVPLNDHQFIIDLAVKFEARVILVSNLYLGSINHTLLTWECLQHRKIPVEGIIFNGITNAQSEKVILRHTRLPVLLRIRPENKVNQEIINQYAGELRERWSR
jgi:dethiobiotin synthetase